jgi:hypothetical protein
MIKLSTTFAAAGLALMLGTASGSASVLITIEQDGFGSGPIKVISEAGQKWTKILDGDLTLPVKIGISNGWFVTYHIKQASGTLIAYGGKSTREWWQETLRCDQAHGGIEHRQCLQRPPEFRRWHFPKTDLLARRRARAGGPLRHE